MMLFQRRLFLELMGNALTTLVLLTFVLFLVASVQAMSKIDGLTMGMFIQTIPIFVAVALDIVLPMSVLIAVVLTYGRAAADNEVDTLRASGVHPMHLLAPGLVFGALMTAVLLAGMDYGKPYAERAKRRLTLEVDVSTVLAQKLASGKPEYLDERTLISAGSIDGNVMRDLTIQFFDTDGRLERQIHSDNARVFVDQDAADLVVELLDFEVIVPTRATGNNFIVRKSLTKNEADLKMRAFTTPQLQAWLMRKPDERGMFREAFVRTEVQMRLSAAAVCLVFVLLGLPVALRFRRSDRVGAFLTAFLLALFLYYPSRKVAWTLAEEGVLQPEIASWSGHAMLLLVALAFCWRLFRR